MQLYIANKNYSSWSLRPWLLMTELRIPFDERLIPFEPDGDWTTLRRISPTGKVPCLVDDERVIWDSLAITEYLHEQHGVVWPTEARARWYARSAVAEMHAGFGVLREICSMNCGIRVRLADVAPPLRADLNRLDALWRHGLERFGGPFLAGASFSAADAFFAPVALRIQTYDLSLSATALNYAARLRALPGMQAWYAAALAEPWRDATHDHACLAHGEMVADLRAGR